MKYTDVDNHCTKCCIRGECECKDCKIDKECECGSNED